MIVSDVFHISCVPNEISNIIKVCGGEPVEGCGGVSCWKVDYATDAIKTEAASTSDILLKLTRIAQQLDVYEISFTMREVNDIRKQIPECLLSQCPNFLDELKTEIKSGCESDTLSQLLHITTLSEHPSVIEACNDIIKETISVKLSEAEGELCESVLPDVIKSINSTARKLSRFVCSKWQHDVVLGQQAYTEFGKMRSDELFDILVKYPSSSGALLDLKTCLVKDPDLYCYLVETATKQLNKRLLHPGADTEDVIQLYIDTMKVIDLLFPGQHRAITAVTSIIQSYMRQRRDGPTIFVLGLINDQNSQLAGILHPELREKRAELCDIEEDQIVEDKRGINQNIRQLDVLKILVTTFGGRDAVLGLYRSVLAERLLGKTDFDADTDLVALELLKIRFGEAALQNCEVMIKDLAESKRFCTQVAHQDSITALIASAHYWPKLPTVSEFVAHPLITSRQELLAKDYNNFKKPRELTWQPGLGSTTLNISLYTNTKKTEKEVVEVIAPVIQATLLLYLAEVQPNGLNAEDLSSKCGLTKSKVTESMLYWTHKAMVRETNGVYVCNDCVTDPQQHQDTETNQASAIMAAEDEELTERVTEFVTMILHNLGPEDVASIENKLRQFMPDYSKTQAQLTVILNKLVASDQLSLRGGKYCKAQNA